MKAVAFIESNFTGIDAIRKSSQAGLKCYLLTSDLQKLKSMLPHDMFDGFDKAVEVIRVDNSDDAEEISRCIRSLGHDISAVTTFSQFRILTTVNVAKKLGLRGTDPSAIATALDKLAVRGSMKRAGAPSIRYLALSSTNEVKKIIHEVGLPCIIKPSRGHSSLGVNLVRTEAELLTVIVKNQLNHSSGDMIVEEYLEGPLFSLETITTGPGEHAVWGYTDRVLSADFIELGATFGSMPPNHQAGVDLVFASLNAIGFDFGACHTEMIFTKNGPRIVEINPRPAGSGACRLIERATDHDVVLDTVRLYLGEVPNKTLELKRSVTMRSILPMYSGRITALPSKDEILQLPGVKDAWFQRRTGDLTDETRSNFSWILTVLAEPSAGRTSVENADAAALWAANRVRIDATLKKSNMMIG